MTQNEHVSTKLDERNQILLDMGLKLKIVPDSWEYTGFWKFGPYWPQK